jgi:hypothetical protein
MTPEVRRRDENGKPLEIVYRRSEREREAARAARREAKERGRDVARSLVRRPASAG